MTAKIKYVATMAPTEPERIKNVVVHAYNVLANLDGTPLSHLCEIIRDQAGVEENEHRRYAPVGTRWPRAASLATTAMFFTVHRIAQYLTGSVKTPAIKDYFHIQRSAFMAAAFVAEYGAYILTAWKDAGVDIAGLADLDYVTFIKPE